MTTLESPRRSRFICQRVTVHFIYSFSLQRKNGSYLVDPSALVKARRSWRAGTPISRRGIAPHLVVKPNSAWHEDRRLNGSVQGRRGSVGRLTRLFPIGGTCCIDIEIPKTPNGELDTHAIQGILHLVHLGHKERTVAAKSKLTLRRDGGADERVYHLFAGAVRELCEASDLKWLDEEFIDVDEETQSPWVVTVAEVEGAVADAFCSSGGLGDDPAREKMLRIREFEHDIAPIVFRSVSAELPLEPAYVDPPTPAGIPGLSSVNLNARLFVTMSRRSILCICPDKNSDPADYFVPGLLDVCEIIRSRWHMLIMMNTILDDTLRHLRDEGETEGSRRALSRTGRRRKLMFLREWLATSLEDPAIYVVAGDALSKIYRELAETFRIDELQTMLLGKINLLDGLYRDMLALRWMEETGERDE